MKSLALVTAILMSASAASAATTGFSLSIDGNGDNNVPTVVLSNTGDLGQIVAFSLTIGNTAYNFDAGYNFVLGDVGSVSLDAGDMNDGGGDRVDTLEFSSTGFDAGETFQFEFDVDIDNNNTVEDYRTRVLPNGSFSVEFSGGLQTLFSVDLTPTTGNDTAPYTYGASVTDVSAVPLPAGLPLLLVGLGAFGLVRNRRS